MNKCDCGAEKARTTHSHWCSVNKPAPATAKSTVFNDDWLPVQSSYYESLTIPEFNDED